MLGHSNLSSTQIYTKVCKQALKDAHRRTHPLAKIEAEAEGKIRL
jgi:site-specific recombinase XerD